MATPIHCVCVHICSQEGGSQFGEVDACWEFPLEDRGVGSLRCRPECDFLAERGKGSVEVWVE